MKEETNYEKWIRQMYEKYKATLFIEKYHLKVTKSEDKDTYLASEFNYPYLDINILYSEKSLKDWKKNKTRRREENDTRILPHYHRPILLYL